MPTTRSSPRLDGLYQVVSAADLIAFGVPARLPALRFYRRPSSGPTVRLYAVGDIAPSGGVRVAAHGEGPAALLRDVAPLLRSGEVVFGNLEVPIVDPAPDDALFAAFSQIPTTLSEAGFTLVNLANNHIYDYGPTGLKSTLDSLQAAGLTSLGAGRDAEAARSLVRTDVGGLRIGWLGCGRTLQRQSEDGPNYWEFDEDELLSSIRLARPQVDVLIVSIHIGLMYLDYPDPEHRAMAGRLVEAGANLVLMHHAHVLQGVEVTGNGAVICHNLGNFLVDRQEGLVKASVMEREQDEGAILLFDLDAEGVCLGAALPTWIDERFHVRWATGERGQQILTRLTRISRALEGDYQAAFLQQRAERNAGHAFKVIWHHTRHGNLGVLLDSLRQVRPRHVGLAVLWVIGRVRSLFRPPSRLAGMPDASKADAHPDG